MTDAIRAAQGQHLRGLSANLTLYWNVMPIVGRLSTGRHTFPPITLPAECEPALRLHARTAAELPYAAQVHACK